LSERADSSVFTEPPTRSKGISPARQIPRFIHYPARIHRHPQQHHDRQPDDSSMRTEAHHSCLCSSIPASAANSPRLTLSGRRITASAHETTAARRLGSWLGSYRPGPDVKDSSMRKTKSCTCGGPGSGNVFARPEAGGEHPSIGHLCTNPSMGHKATELPPRGCLAIPDLRRR
jgi:hypothetical protein